MPLRRAHTPVAELLARTMDTFLQQSRAADVELHTERATDVPATVFVDGAKIAWALGTLVGSSLRHAVRGKVVPARVDVRVSCSTEDLWIVVEDTGPGMAPSIARWLFTHDPSTGKTSGTALRLVADVIAAHRGEISAASVAGRGAQFTMRIPRR